MCDVCEYASVHLSNLMKHKRLIHGNREIERNHKCNRCDKSFHYASRLKSHIDFVHEGLRLHKCNFCEKSFSVSAKLRRHVESLHERNKDHKKYNDERNLGNMQYEFQNFRKFCESYLTGITFMANLKSNGGKIEFEFFVMQLNSIIPPFD